MIIGKLTVENVKRIKAVEISPDGNLVRITGKNANGKSSILDSISMLFCGKKLIPERPVRDGEEAAKIEAEAGEYIITRHWTSPDKSYLTLRNKDGAKFSNAQSILDGFVNDLSFDPIHFTLSKPQERIEKLREITGIDLTELDRECNNAYALRRDYGRDLKKQTSVVETLKHNLGPDESEENYMGLRNDLKKVKEEIEEVNKKNEEIRSRRSKTESLRAKEESENEKINAAKSRIQKLEDQIRAENELIENSKKEIMSIKVELQGMGDLQEKFIEVKALEEMRTLIVSKIAESDAKAREKMLCEDAIKELESIQKSYDEQDSILKRIDYKKSKMFETCIMPIDGLGFGVNDVDFKGMPFSQLSTSEQIRISMSIAIAKNPKLKVIVINNGSLLDEDALKEVESIAKENNFQVWIEEVASSKQEGCIFIQDGEAI